MSKLNRSYIIDIVLIALAIIPVLYSFFLDYQKCDDCYYWFQRSGSLMVLFAVFLEINSLKYYEVKTSSNVFINGASSAIDNEVPRLKKTIQKIAFSLIIIGTFIWGYGDIPFKASPYTQVTKSLEAP